MPPDNKNAPAGKQGASENIHRNDPIIPGNMQGKPDILSILTHKSFRMAKTWRADGSILDYANAKNFNLSEPSIANIHDLSGLLYNLEKITQSFLVRGKYIGEGKNHLRRIKENFVDQPLHAILIEIDNFKPKCADPVLNPVLCIEEYVTKCLPVPFHSISYHWQLSNSAGHPTKQGLLKAHVWFWLNEARSSAALRAWADTQGIDCDKAVFRYYVASSP